MLAGRRKWLLRMGSAALFAPVRNVWAVSLKDLQWSRRIIVAFGEDGDPSVEQFLELVRENSCELNDRDLDVYLVSSHGLASATPEAPELDADAVQSLTSLRHLTSTEFEMVLVGKDGGVKARAEVPTELPQFLILIDGMPMRQRELEERGENC